ncbi:substrate-binding domain-containing protein [Vreelandella rituensis]|uniref:LacI family transcriptional regulator n=1 Tax=Vreelandella rituensis TaxID=2282306 RepID=A0A368U0B3_9GAMM|nr:substrate-binding domain-containing protein [Halomonas rituensis]RCV89927.1 LacI family transcriptional regulator [Halomonas rituensis]
MKKINKVLLALVLSTAAMAISASEKAATFVVAFAQDDLSNDWRLAQVKDAQGVFEAYPDVEFVYTDGQGQTALQVAHIHQLIEQKIDALITSPREILGASQVIREAYERGIPVILLDRHVDHAAYSTFLHNDNYNIGLRAAQFLDSALEGKGRILMLEGLPGATPTILRREGFINFMEQRPGIELVARTGNYLRRDAILILEEFLSQGNHFDAIYSHSDSMLEGARMVMKRYDINPGDIPTVGIDYIQGAQDALLAGQQSASFTYPTLGEEGAEAALTLLAGEIFPKTIMNESIMVTVENATEIVPIF